jgi:hypothetical protein
VRFLPADSVDDDIRRAVDETVAAFDPNLPDFSNILAGD